MTISHPARPIKVAIAGGGPGGLATAIALDKVPNVDVVLYEKSAVLREVGAGISIGQNSWNVLELLGVAGSVTSGHPTLAVLNLNGRTGEELTRTERVAKGKHTSIRTERTHLQSALLKHVKPGVIRYGKKLQRTEDLGDAGVEMYFTDGSSDTADLLIGLMESALLFAMALGQPTRSSSPAPRYGELFSLARSSKPWIPRFDVTGWWHLPTSHIWFSPVGPGLSEIAAREYQDPKIHSASKSTWGIPVTNEYVESHFTEYLPQIQAAIKTIPNGAWREFAAYAGPELSTLTAWNNKIVLVGDASHALSGAFGSGAGFAMEDGWVLAQSLELFGNDLNKALSLFNEIRLPYYAKMYAHLDEQKQKRADTLGKIETPIEEDRVRSKVIGTGEKDMSWIYEHDIGKTWEKSLDRLGV